MTQEIIQMARDSGMELYGLGKDRARFVHHLEAFAKLVAERALAQPEQEPVAWMHIQGNYQESSFRQLDDWEIKNGFKQYPLYTTPPQRTERSGWRKVQIDDAEEEAWRELEKKNDTA
jgi:hypothetical protein